MAADGGSEWIRQQVVAMQLVVADGGDDDRLAREFPVFRDKHPALFAKASRPMSDADMSILATMLDRLCDIASGQLTAHEADVELGEILADRYVRPLLG